MLGSNTDTDRYANYLIEQAKNLGVSDSEILNALTSKEGSNNDSRMIIGLLKLIASYSSSGGATDEQVASAVNKYLTENPVQAYDDTEVKSSIASLNSNLQEVTNIFEKNISIAKEDLVTGYINSVTGNLSSNNNFLASDFIKITGVIPISNINVTCEFVDASGVAFYDKTKNFIKGYSVNDGFPKSTVGNYTLEVPNNSVYIRFGFISSHAPNISYIKFLSVEKLIQEQEQEQEIVYVEGGYISIKGTINKLANYSYSSLIALFKGEHISVSTIGQSPGNVSMLSKWSSDGITFKDNLYTSTTTTQETIEYDVQEEVEYLRICYFSNYGATPTPTVKITKQPVRKYVIENTKNIQDIFSNLKDSCQDNYWCYSLSKVLCIGDSLTSGASYTEAWGEMANKGSSIDENIPRILGRMLNAQVTNGGFSGYSASTWWTKYTNGTINNSNPYDFSQYDTFIIWLGTNDGFTDTLDTDVEPYNDYHDYAETETGYYCKIIEEIKHQNNSCLIVLVKIFASKSDVSISNNVIEKIAERYNLKVIDNSDLGITARPDLHANENNPHFGKAGNIYIANRYVKELGKWFAENPLRAEYGYTPRTN